MLQKSKVREAILNALRLEFESFAAISRKTRSTGNDAQTKSEGKYDTRSTEENYLADGQARQAHSARLALASIAALPLRTFDAGTAIDVGALVQLQLSADEKMWFFLAPAAGGLEITVDGEVVTIITLDSPLGRDLQGSRLGELTTRPSGRILAVV